MEGNIIFLVEKFKLLGDVQIVSVDIDIFWERLRLLGRLRYLWGGGVLEIFRGDGKFLGGGGGGYKIFRGGG